MKWLVAGGLAVGLGTVVRSGMSGSQGPGCGPVEAGKGGDKRPLVQDRRGWRTYHGNPALDGVAGTAVPDAPELLWKFKAGNRVDFTPVSDGSRLYFTTAKGGLFAV